MKEEGRRKKEVIISLFILPSPKLKSAGA